VQLCLKIKRDPNPKMFSFYFLIFIGRDQRNYHGFRKVMEGVRNGVQFIMGMGIRQIPEDIEAEAPPTNPAA